MSYEEAGSARAAIGSALAYNGITKRASIGFYFINRPEWIILDHACSAYSYISVPLYDTLGPDAVKFVVNHATVQVIFCVQQTLNILMSFLSEIPTVCMIVVVGGRDEQIPSLPSGARVQIISYSSLLQQGRNNLRQFCPPNPEDIATICYTSGTTGTPKGAVLSHGNLIANVAGTDLGVKLYPSDIYISYLSLAHIYERVNQIGFVYCGVAVGFYQGDVMKLVEDMAVLRPTICCSVPRLYNRIYDGCFGCRVTEGYGMTESSRVVTTIDADDVTSGHVGSPNPACEIKLIDVPEMNYTSCDQPHPRGEICIRGPIIFQGYYKDDEQTREAIDSDGWLHTGDVGLWLPGGRLKIIDRKKNIFKLAQGEYIAPEKIENVYAKCKFVSQCFIHGDSFNSCLVAVVSVDVDVLKAWALSEGIMYQDLQQLCNNPRARAAVLADMDGVGREAQLRGFEFARAVTLVAEPFTVENGLLTPTFKLKRPQMKAHFAKVIEDMYAKISTSDSS